MKRIVLLLAVALASAGCIGFLDGEGENGGDEPPDNSPDDFGENDSHGNASGNGSANESGNESGNASGNGTADDEGFGDENESSWTYENRSGTASGTNLLVTQTGGAEEPITVENGTLKLQLNVTADGGALDLCLRTSNGSECMEEASTSEGNASISVDAPQAGDYVLELAPSDPGQSSVDYELLIGKLVTGNTAEA